MKPIQTANIYLKIDSGISVTAMMRAISNSRYVTYDCRHTKRIDCTLGKGSVRYSSVYKSHVSCSNVHKDKKFFGDAKMVDYFLNLFTR